jgi:predicted ATP-binding protein involved in virulence
MPQKKNNSKQTKVSAERNGDKPQNAYFLSLELENVRCFGEKQSIDFSDDRGKPKQWTIILGDNATGKTTLLRCFAAMLPVPYPTPKDRQVPYLFKEIELTTVFLRKGNEPFKVWIDLSFSSFLKKNINSESYGFEGGEHSCLSDQITQNIKVNCFTYAATRKAGEVSISEEDEEDIYKNLFDESTLLVNPEEWLLQTDYASKRESEFKEKRKTELELTKKILIKILPDVDDIRFNESESSRTPKPIVEFHTPYGWVESKDMSLGYRTSMAWIVDFASRMFDRYPESENPLAEPAVVLIDEIDLHLHPKWQRELIDYLTNLFPNTQFIVTTHSPLIVQAAAARDANIVVCRREGDHVIIDQSVEAVKNWRTDQILTSDLFDLPTARPKEIEPFLAERQKILSKAKLTKKDEKRLTELENEIGFMPVMENPTDDKAMDIIRRAAERLQTEIK